MLAERVAVGAHAPEFGSFRHFHEVTELVLFRRVEGEFIAGGNRHRLTDGAIAFVPSMHDHDYALARGAMEWVLIQIDAYFVESFSARHGIVRLKRPFCAVPEPAASMRMNLLADWLVEAAADEGDRILEPLVELLLIAAAEAPEVDVRRADEEGLSIERLLPALERLRSAPEEPIGLREAASVCNLSPEYFSRRFKQALGMNFSDYGRVYRLHLAAQRIARSRRPISEIGYRLGFSSPSHFTARFRERFGMTPREYRASVRDRGRAQGRELP